MSHLFIISFLVTISSWNSKVSIKINKTITNNVQKSKVIRPLVLIDKNKKIKTKREYTNNIIVFLIKLHLKLAVSLITHPLT